jgi:hypothetical protein
MLPAVHRLLAGLVLEDAELMLGAATAADDADRPTRLDGTACRCQRCSRSGRTPAPFVTSRFIPPEPTVML